LKYELYLTAHVERCEVSIMLEMVDKATIHHQW